MSKKRKNKKFLKKLLVQKYQQQSQNVQPQISASPEIQKAESQIKIPSIPPKQNVQTPEPQNKDEAIDLHDREVRAILFADIRKIIFILIIISALFVGIYFVNQRTTIFNAFSQKLFNIFTQS